MKKSNITFYTNVLVQADIDFLNYQISKRKINLIPGTGLQKLIEECQSYIAIPPDGEVYNTSIKPILVLYSLSNSLRILWMKRKDFNIQLSSMNSGEFEYGKISDQDEHNFKDFELEIFSAAHLNEYGLEAILPQHTMGNDIFYKDIEIQCKHPDNLKRDKIDGFLRTFQASLQKSQKYGVFGIGIDDYLSFTDNSFPIDFEGFERAYRSTLQVHEKTLNEIFSTTLPFCPRVLG